MLLLISAVAIIWSLAPQLLEAKDTTWHPAVLDCWYDCLASRDLALRQVTATESLRTLRVLRSRRISSAYEGRSRGTGTVRFTGKERDFDTGLDYFGTRYFSSAQGRFTSPDRPLVDQSTRDPQSWNLYSYVRNNPLRFVDPTGMKCVKGVHDETGDACFEATGTTRRDNASPGGILTGFFKNLANLFIGAYNATSDVTEQVDGIPNGQVSYHRITPFEYQSTAEDRGAVIATAATFLGTGLERFGLKTAEIAFSSRTVAAAAKEIQAGATTIKVATKSEAEELFLRLYQGAGYRNTTGMSATEAKNFFGSKAYTYHWDTTAGHGPLNPHGTGPHLQVHPPQGPTIRIFYGPQQ